MALVARVAAVAAALVCFGAPVARAEVSLEPARGTEPWRARVIESVLSQIEGAEAAEIAGTLGPTSLELVVRHPRRPPRVATIDLKGLELETLERRVAALLAPAAEAPHAASASPAPEPPLRRGPAAAVLLVVLAVLVAPLVPGRRLRPVAAVAIALAAAAGALAFTDLELPAWALFGGGGVAWGLLVAGAVPVALPPLTGFGRLEAGTLSRLLSTWALMAGRRLLGVALIAAPLGAGVALACAALRVPGAAAWALVVPGAGLLALVAARAWTAPLAAWLDGELVARHREPASARGERTGRAAADNPWHVAVAGYFAATARRTGWDAEVRLPPALFLPGPGEAIWVYGGGATPTRVVIGIDLLELSLAPYDRPHDYAAPREDKLHWSEWNAGLVVPGGDYRRGILLAKLAAMERRKSGLGEEPAEREPVALGQPPTLAGFVEPSAIDQRLSHRPAEDPLWLEWDPGADADDGTDPSDKDLLFGVVLRELLVAARGDDVFATYGAALRLWWRRRPPRLRLLGARAARPLCWLLSRPTAALADAGAAQLMARHPLVQYLAWRAWREPDLLTARASMPELERRTAAIAARLGRLPATGDPEALARLAPLLASWRPATRSRRGRALRWGAVAIAAAAAALALGAGVVRALEYHPTYVDRLERATDQEPSHGNH